MIAGYARHASARPTKQDRCRGPDGCRGFFRTLRGSAWCPESRRWCPDAGRRPIGRASCNAAVWKKQCCRPRSRRWYSMTPAPSGTVGGAVGHENGDVRWGSRCVHGPLLRHHHPRLARTVHVRSDRDRGATPPCLTGPDSRSLACYGGGCPCSLFPVTTLAHRHAFRCARPPTAAFSTVPLRKQVRG